MIVFVSSWSGLRLVWLGRSGVASVSRGRLAHSPPLPYPAPPRPRPRPALSLAGSPALSPECLSPETRPRPALPVPTYTTAVPQGASLSRPLPLGAGAVRLLGIVSCWCINGDEYLISLPSTGPLGQPLVSTDRVTRQLYHQGCNFAKTKGGQGVKSTQVTIKYEWIRNFLQILLIF